MTKNFVTIAGVKYEVYVQNGVRYIDGKTVNEFMEGLGKDTISDLTLIGTQVIKDGITGKKGMSYQEMANIFHQKRNN